MLCLKLLCCLNNQEGDGDFSQISSEENELDDELPSNIVSVYFFRISISLQCFKNVGRARGRHLDHKNSFHIFQN